MINVYPKIAKYAFYLLWVLFAIATLLFMAFSIFDLHQEARREIALAMLALAFPTLPTYVYFCDIVEMNAREYHVVDNPNLKEKIRDLLKDVTGVVRVGTYESTEPNAFAISSLHQKKSLIAFSSQLLTIANDEQFMALAAHEVAHIQNNDAQNKMYILAFHHALQIYPKFFAIIATELSRTIGKSAAIIGVILILVTAISQGLIAALSAAYMWLEMVFKILWAPAAIIGGFYLLNHILRRVWSSYSRAREFAADAGGAALTSKCSMIAGLSLIVENDLEKLGIFDTHPPTSDRIARLKSLTADHE